MIATGNHLLVQLKRNQPLLHDAMVEYTRGHPFVDEHHTHEIGRRNRIEKRAVHVWHLHPSLGSAPWYDHFRALIRVQRHTERFDTRLRDWRVSKECAYYLCDLVLPAARFSEAIRNHWRVENRAHYVRDTRFQEDASRIRRNPCTFALLRSFALNLMRFNRVENISQGLYDNALCLDRVLAYEGL
ncbi:ISAs1 family transposase [Nitrococcus mobilis]|uniref:ISMca6, transposase, OrfB n=1 Tax=Nitrococcus mobilis Nb-231 TaxID=314278 RepID=A4BTE7_9GAMM|nr:ISAs1 family transposase [Nitrococcus mobilis]EAR21049.1 ISMca6, transposase, OrfB [Nitrococcus mobilis Nb-231]